MVQTIDAAFMSTEHTEARKLTTVPSDCRQASCSVRSAVVDFTSAHGRVSRMVHRCGRQASFASSFCDGYSGTVRQAEWVGRARMYVCNEQHSVWVTRRFNL